MGKMKNVPVPIIAVDFEGSRSVGIVEYGAAEFFGGELRAVRTRICRPDSRISERDRALFDISDADARACRPFSDDIDLFVDMRRRGVFCAHNASVEDSLLRAQAVSPGEVPDFVRGGTCVSWGPWLDSFAFCKNAYPSLDSAKLSNAVDALGISGELDELALNFCPPGRRKWHCALFDAIACGLIYARTCSSEGFEGVTLAWLAEQSGVKGASQRDFGQLV